MVETVFFKTYCRVGAITPLHFTHEETELQEGCASCNLVRAETGLERISA